MGVGCRLRSTCTDLGRLGVLSESDSCSALIFRSGNWSSSSSASYSDLFLFLGGSRGDDELKCWSSILVDGSRASGRTGERCPLGSGVAEER